MLDLSPGTRAMYGADASNYRRIPVGVAFPRSAEEVAEVLAHCRSEGLPLTMRGGGTSVAGNAIGDGIVVDTSRHLRRFSVDPETRTAVAEPGVVLRDLQRAAAAHGLAFGPDPSTASRCTVGGMIGNNSCGSHSLAWGTTADNVLALDVLRADGSLLTAAGDPSPDLRALEERYRETWRTELSSYGRRTSGYGVEHLLPERGRSVARSLVGSEGTCAIVLGATLALVAPPPHRALAVLAYPDDVAAAEAVPALLGHRPLALEGLDAALVRGAGLPDAGAYLFVEFGGSTPAEAESRARALGGLTLTETADQARLWRVRADGAGIATRDTTGGEAWPGWEDAAVPPERLPSYLREFRALLRRYGLRGVNYGHFGEGCIHVRISFDLLSPRGVSVFRSFLEDAADTVVAHGGSLSGEHGDGRARSELLARMYSPRVLESFAAFKRAWDPDGVLNPGVVIDPEPLDAGLRYAGLTDLPAPVLRYPEDGGDLHRALRRCVGVGKCRSDVGAVMCPSWLVTGEEKHSTRGRARLLQEIAGGTAVPDGWRSRDAAEALDLCLSCKGCSADCPVGVDMATYKAEFLYHHHRHRLRPRAHYSMGWLPLTSRLASRAPALVNAVSGSRLVKWLGGIDPARPVPAFRRTFTSSYRSPAPMDADVLLWPDTFNDHFSPAVLHSGARVLAAAGLAAGLPREGVCCGLTWFSTGQLGMARRVLSRTERLLSPAVRAGTPLVVLEPSCATMLRADARAVLGDTPFTAYLTQHVLTLAEALERLAPQWTPPVVDRPAVGQVHCHQSSVLGFDADARLMSRAGIDPAGMVRSCCGLAGNFGFERGHHDVSRAVADRVLLPAVAGAPDGSVLLADGFSCRTQLAHLAGREGLHLAEVLAARLDSDSPDSAKCRP
jgi:FAD/FMN-containing dehydrogenase/Fe-S oxidoreductase